MLDWLTSQGYTVHLSPGLVVLEKAGVLMDYPGVSDAYAAVKRRAEQARYGYSGKLIRGGV